MTASQKPSKQQSKGKGQSHSKLKILGEVEEFLSTAKTKSASVGLVGDLALDRFVFGAVDRISPEAPVPVLLVEREVEQPGCAANVARNMAELFSRFPGADLFVHGVLGGDSAGERLKSRLQELSPSKMHLFLLQEPSRPTPLKTRYLAGSQRSQQQMLRVDVESTSPLSASAMAKIEKELLENLHNYSVLVIQDYAKGLLEPQFLQRLLLRARKEGVRTIVDPNRNTPAESYKNAWAMTPNVEEAEKLLGRSLHKGAHDDEMVQACRDLKRLLGLDVAVITRSRYGMTVLDQSDHVLQVPALARAVSDVTGAGDTLVAVLALALAFGASMTLSAELANAAAAVVVGKIGTATASWDEILDELKHQMASA